MVRLNHSTVRPCWTSFAALDYFQRSECVSSRAPIFILLYSGENSEAVQSTTQRIVTGNQWAPSMVGTRVVMECTL